MKASNYPGMIKSRKVPTHVFEGMLPRAEKAADNHMVKEGK